ncbi:MAG: TetR/AcrR family transcriptional regulator, partial [Halobacteriaceae archaeon]
MESESGPTAEIMDATYRALCRHGYADLTMQRIADELSLSKAAVHYHYETKEDLLNAFLEHLLDRFEQRLASQSSDPRTRLDTFLDAVFGPAEEGDNDFAIALTEIKAQSPFNEGYRNR